ncbi:MAG: hypothetical protein WBI55_01510 [Eubacteriales bacterium]|jgi:hypothetical protein|nr:hypothetical protein [Clostridiales bacterium]
MLKIKSLAISALAHIVGIASFYLIFLYLTDLEYPKLLLISAKTGKILFPFCILSFTAGIVYLLIRIDGNGGEASKGGLLLASLPHLSMIFSFLEITLVITNHHNHAMNFLTDDLSKVVMLFLVIISLMTAVCLHECAVFMNVQSRRQ